MSSIVSWFPTDKQEILNKMVTGLRAQKWRVSEISPGACRLRGEGDTKCAIGHLIPDDKYFPEMEYTSFINAFGIDDTDLAAFLDACRSAHDYAFHNMEARFRQVAKNYNLVFPE